MTSITQQEFKKIKEALKKKPVAIVASKFDWSKTTIRRVLKARSLKQYRDLCVAY
jgi:hypothetical protein